MATSTRSRKRSTPKQSKKSPAKKRPKQRPKKAVRPNVPLVRTSERTSFKRCAWLWDRTYNEHRKPIEEKPALKFGTLVHTALEARYPQGLRRGPKPAETFEKIFLADPKHTEYKWGFKTYEDGEAGDWEDALHIGVSMLEMFIEEYGRDEEWEVIQSEMTFKTPVYGVEMDHGLFIPCDHTEDRAQLLFYYVGTIDNVLRNRMDQSVFINDWKTTGNDPVKEAQGKAVLDEQATAYWTWGADALIREKILKPRDIQNLNGMLYTMLRKAKRDERPKDDKTGAYLNQDGSVSKRQPPPYFHRELVYRSQTERERARERAISEYSEMLKRKAGTLPIFKTPETGSMGHCSWCPVRDICEVHEQGGDWKELRNLTTEEWDPYSAHEIQEEGKAR